jgi:peptide deformylase
MSSVISVEKNQVAKPPLELQYLGDRALRGKAKRIAKVDQEIRKLAEQMLQTMYAAKGIGLAAPQVDINKQIIVIDCESEESANKPLILINPEITGYSEEKCGFEEGCLSIPGVYLEVIRPEVVFVSFKDENGRPKKLKASGLLSRVIQHEMDHLHGVLFVDRVQNTLALTDELKKHGFAVQAVQPYQE